MYWPWHLSQVWTMYNTNAVQYCKIPVSHHFFLPISNCTYSKIPVSHHLFLPVSNCASCVASIHIFKGWFQQWLFYTEKLRKTTKPQACLFSWRCWIIIFSFWPAVSRSCIKFSRDKKKKKKKRKEREPSAEKLQDRKSKGSTEQNKEVKKGNQMTALRFQTGGWHPTSLASLQGHVQDYRLKKANRHMT